MSYQPLLLWKNPSKKRFFDSFDRVNGVLGSPWIAPTWSIVGNQAINTPVTFGVNKFALGSMETDSGWINAGTPTTQERSNEQAHAGTYSRKIVSDATSEGAYNSVTGLTQWQWYLCDSYLYIVTGSARLLDASGNVSSAVGPIISATGSWAYTSHADLQLAGTTMNPGFRSVAVASTFYADDFQIRAYTLSELFALVPVRKSNMTMRIKVAAFDTWTGPIGIALRVNDPVNPTSGIVVIMHANGGSTSYGVYEFTAPTTWVQLYNTTVSWISGDTLIVKASGMTITGYRKTSAGVIFPQTPVTTTIASGGYAGIFGTHSNNTIEEIEIKY